MRECLLVLLVITPFALAEPDSPEVISECDKGQVPYTAIIRETGKVEVGCQAIKCANNNIENQNCDDTYHVKNCVNSSFWITGVRQPTGPQGPALQSRCCDTGRRLNGKARGSIKLQKKQGYFGGDGPIEVKGQSKKRDGYDVITNVVKEGNTYQVWVTRLQGCSSSGGGQQATKDPSIDYQNFQEDIPQPAPAQSANAANGAKAAASPKKGCFDSETIVYSETRGPIPMSKLEVGENVLTVHGHASSYRPVSFFVHRNPEVTTKFLTLHTDQPEVKVTMTPFHITYGGPCSTSAHAHPPKFANEIQPGQCLVLLKPNGQLENIRVTNVTVSYRRGIYSPITPNGVIVTNNLVSSCYSFIKNQELQATIFNAMLSVENILHRYFFFPAGWLLGGEQVKVDVPRALDYMIKVLDHIVPMAKYI